MEAQQLLNPNAGGPKFRQLPCRTFDSVGSCPYKEKCVYLHDYRLGARDYTKGKAGRGVSSLMLCYILLIYTSSHMSPDAPPFH